MINPLDTGRATSNLSAFSRKLVQERVQGKIDEHPQPAGLLGWDRKPMDGAYSEIYSSTSSIIHDSPDVQLGTEIKFQVAGFQQ